MFFLYLTALLLVTGGIHSGPVAPNFDFEVDSQKIEVMTAYLGKSAVINCTTNDPQADVRLQKVPIGSHPIFLNEGDKLTRNGAMFTIHHVDRHDGARYKCVAEKNGQVISREIRLVVMDQSKVNVVISPSLLKKALLGSKAFFTCEGSFGGTVHWYSGTGDHSLLLPSARLPGVSVVPYSQNKFGRKDLVFTNVHRSHTGIYSCKLSAHGIHREATAYLQASGPIPVNISHPSKDETIVLDRTSSSLELKCFADGFPSPEISWKKDGKPVKTCLYATQDCRYILGNDSLIISEFRDPEDIGVFQCLARNEKGSKDERNFQVGFPEKPVLRRDVNTIFSWPSDHPFSCEVLGGYPMPTFRWWFSVSCFNRQECLRWIDAKRKPGSAHFTIHDDTSKSTLKIHKNVRFPPGLVKFKCEAKNDYGKDTVEYDLVVQRKS